LLIALTLVIVVSVRVAGSPAQAQSEDWSAPVNLSHCGAASNPVVLAGPDGAWQVFWWDQFDGLMAARWEGKEWSEPVGEELVSKPMGAMPQIEADAGGRAHAWWLGTPDKETGARPLMHSGVTIGDTAWSAPHAVAESALIWNMASDPKGGLHLVYVRVQHTDAFPAGVYYTRSTNGDATWSTPQALYNTIYFRLLSVEEAHVQVAADGQGHVHVVWDDPRLEKSFYARSADGIVWEEPREVGNPEEGARRIQVAVGQEGEVLLLWEATRVAAPCALYQQRSADFGATWGPPERVLEDLGRCPEGRTFLRTAEGALLWVGGQGSEGLTLAAWDGTQWSEPKYLGFSFEDPELGSRVYLDSLRATLSGGQLAVVGRGQDGEVWLLENQVDALDWAFAPPPPWSEPANVSQSQAVPGLPAIAADAEGRVHVLWSEASEEGAPGTALYYARWGDQRWTRPASVLQSAEGGAWEPALAAVGEQLHAVWSGGRGGEMLYSWAYARDAYAPGAWSEPQPLPAPGPVGCCSAIAADSEGRLHVVYAVPLNEGRGIYYTRSDDGAWSEAEVVFDAAAAGWSMVTHPRLAVDEQGTVHVVWVRAALPGTFPPEGVFYARSTDEGGVWSEPLAVAEGAYDWPLVAASGMGQVHLLWNEATGRRGWWQQWSSDSGEGWTSPQRVPGLTEVPGPVGVATDGVGALHLVGLGHDDAGEPALFYVTWDGSRWNSPETFPLEMGGDAPGVVVALQAALGRLDVAFRGETEEEGAKQVDVWHTSRAVPAVAVTPAPTFTPQPTATPTSMPLPTATPRPTVNPETPMPSPPSLELGPINLPLTSVGGILLAALIVVGVVGAVATRGLWTGRQ
jgi:uncharacterized protein (DUF736 family)